MGEVDGFFVLSKLKGKDDDMDDDSLPENINELISIASKAYEKQDLSAYKILERMLDNLTVLDCKRIISNPYPPAVKSFALQVFESFIKYNWNSIAEKDLRELLIFLTTPLTEVLSADVELSRIRFYVNKIFVVIAQILKHLDSENWSTIIQGTISLATNATSDTSFGNGLALLKLLSEELFDFAEGEMTSHKITQLRSDLTKDFETVSSLCLDRLVKCSATNFTTAALDTLHVFLSRIPSSQFLNRDLLGRLFQFTKPCNPYPILLRCLALQYLTEVAAQTNKDDCYRDIYAWMYKKVIKQLRNLFPEDLHIFYQCTDIQSYFQNLALFVTTFHKSHMCDLELILEHKFQTGLKYLLKISYFDDREIFRFCLDYWNSLVLELGGPKIGMGESPEPKLTQRRKLYAKPMSMLRSHMISRMTRPEEVLIVEDENGNIVRETLKDTDDLVQYEIWSSLIKQVKGDWTRKKFTSLCSAIGCISGSMTKEQSVENIDTILTLLWVTVRHIERNLAKSGARLLCEMLKIMQPIWRWESILLICLRS